MHVVALLAVVAAVLGLCAGMPYQVPLQGKQGGMRTLVILDDMAKMHENSIFFNNLSALGYALSFLQCTSAELKIKKYGVYLYDNIVMFNADDFNTISFDDITEFVNEGGNLLVAMDGALTPAMRAFAEQSGVDFDAKGSSVIDNFSNVASADAR